MKDAVLAAFDRIRTFVRETPTEESSEIVPGQPVFLKLEHLQRTGSFKFRGASNKIALLTAGQARAGVVAASNGNHGMGVAAAASARVFISPYNDLDVVAGQGTIAVELDQQVPSLDAVFVAVGGGGLIGGIGGYYKEVSPQSK